MSDMPSRNIPDDGISIGPGQGTDPEQEQPPRRRRRGLRIALVSAASLVVFLGAVVVGGFLAVNHLTANIQRIPHVFAGLDAANQPVMPAATRHSLTILLTGDNVVPPVRRGTGVDHSSTVGENPSGLIALVHINANRRAGAVVSIPPTALVDIPGHGVRQLEQALPLGGPSLLIRSVEHLTNVRIDHYSVVNFMALIKVLRPLGGVSVDIPEYTSSGGFTFHPGINFLDGPKALAYVRQPSLTEEQRVLRQQALLRAIVQKLAAKHLLEHPISDFKVLNAFTRALSVDSNFTNSQLDQLALHIRILGSHSATFVTAPVRRTVPGGVKLNRRVSHQLWAAIRHDSIAAFARRFPFTVTPAAPR